MLRTKTVLITRPESRSAELLHNLKLSSDTRVIFIPLIEIVPPGDGYLALDKSIHNLSEYDGLIFSSTNGVNRFFDRLEVACRDVDVLPKLVAAVGPMTKARLIRRGVKEVIEAEVPGSNGLIAALKKSDIGNRRFLFPRAREGRDEVVEWLREQGCTVDVVEAYRTILPDDLDSKKLIDLIDRDEIDQVVFASQSAVKNFVHVLGEDRVMKFSKEKESLFWNGSFFRLLSF